MTRLSFEEQHIKQNFKEQEMHPDLARLLAKGKENKDLLKGVTVTIPTTPRLTNRDENETN